MQVKVTVQITLDMEKYDDYDDTSEGAKNLIEDCLSSMDIIEEPVIVLEPVTSS